MTDLDVPATTALNPAYLGARDDVISLIPGGTRSALDVGCSAGALGRRLKEAADVRVVGIERMPEAAALAEAQLDRVLLGDVQSLLDRQALGDERFDAIVLADVLEHLSDPWGALRIFADHLEPGGVVVASIPNVRHYTTLLSLLAGRWPYRDRGIHDSTHLRFFTKRNVRELFAGADLEIDVWQTNYRLVERPHALNSIARLFAWPGLRGFLAFQYLVRARRR